MRIYAVVFKTYIKNMKQEGAKRSKRGLSEAQYRRKIGVKGAGMYEKSKQDFMYAKQRHMKILRKNQKINNYTN